MKMKTAGCVAAALLVAMLASAVHAQVGVIGRGEAIERQADLNVVSRGSIGGTTVISRGDALSGGDVGAAARTQRKRVEFRISESADAVDRLTRTLGSSAGAAERAAGQSTYVDASSMSRVFRYAGKFEKKHRDAGLHLWYQAEVDVVGTLTDEDATARVEAALSTLRSADGVVEAHVQEVPELYAFSIQDPLYSSSNQQYHYPAAGLTDAWQYQRGQPRADGKKTVVQLIDSGTDDAHPDMQRSRWVNAGEICGNGIDDDNNGFVDDCYGYNHADDRSFPLLGGGSHGTHCAGTVAADNNQLGVAGAAGGEACSADTGVVYMTSTGFGDTATRGFGEAFIYGADMGADVSSNSWGYGGCGGGSSNFAGWPNTAERAAVDYFAGAQHANGRGGVVVFAAGNSNEDCEYYPAYYPPVVAVASTGNSGSSIADYSVRSGFSNYGASWIDIAAPGGSIYSTVATFEGSYATYSGTSMACPHVAGIFGLMAHQCPGLTPDQYKSCMFSSANYIEYQSAGDLGAGLVDADAAIKCLVNRFPNDCLPTDPVEPCADQPPAPPPPPSPPPPDCSMCIATGIVKLLSDNYCDETSWQLMAAGQSNLCLPEPAALLPGEACPTGATTEVTNLCPGEEYTFTIRDSYGDGMCCGYGQGSYELTVEGETIKTGGEFGGSEVTDFTVPDDGPDGAWVLSGRGKRNTCAKKCQKLGKTCNASTMHGLDTGATVSAAMAEGGVTCDTVNNKNRQRKQEGVPGVKMTKKGNVCFPSRVGNRTTCDKKAINQFRTLCWCE